MTDRPIVAIDCETTGLDPDWHDVFEVAYQRLGIDAEPVTLWLPHDDSTADPKAMEINRGYERWPGAYTRGWEFQLRTALTGAHLLGSNPAFDASFLRRRLDSGAVWHHRLIDIATYAMPVLGLDTPIGLANIRQMLIERECFQVLDAVPDHTAAGDVRATVACWDVLRALARPLPPLTVLRPLRGEDADDFEVLWAPGEGPRGDG